MKTFFKKILIWANIFVVLALLIAYLSPYSDPNKFWFVSFFGLFYPVIFLLNIAAIVLWVFIDMKMALISIIAISMGYNHFININLSSKKVEKTDIINIATYNVMSGWKGKSGEFENESLKNKLSELFEDIDILVLQEANAYVQTLFDSILTSHQLYDADKGVIIYSRLPIINEGIIEFGTRSNSCLWVDLLNNSNDTIRLYGLHLQSNKITSDAKKVAEEIDLQEKKTWTGVGNIMKKYRKSLFKRANQTKKILAHKSNWNGPSIITGDFNDPTLSYVFHELKSNMKDSFLEAGTGLGITYGGSIPLLRIDHMLFSDHFQILNSKVKSIDFSDHYPVLSKVSLKEL